MTCTIIIHHGSEKAKKYQDFDKFNVVITTYGYVSSEFKSNGPLFQTYWTRVILDESHVIRNKNTLISEACCELYTKYRWI